MLTYFNIKHLTPTLSGQCFLTEYSHCKSPYKFYKLKFDFFQTILSLVLITTDLYYLVPIVVNSPKTWQEPGNKQKTTYNIYRKWLIIWLSRQVSNLNSSDPESDVLPITPRDKFAGQI